MKRLGRRILAGVVLLAVASQSSAVFAITTLRTESVDVTTGFTYPDTNAVVDTVKREIRLPPYAMPSAGIIDGRPDGYEVVTISGDKVESYSFNGSQMVKNNELSLTPATSPLAVAGRMNNTDVVVLGETQATRYSFNGSGMAENPFMSVAGLTAPMQVATRPNDSTTVALDGTSIRAFGSNGSASVENPALSITSGLTNPVAFALRSQTYDVAVVDGTEIKYYGFNGSSLSRNPFMSVSGLTDPVAVQVSKDGTLFVQESGGITAYGFDGTQMKVNAYLSVPQTAGVVGMALVGKENTLAIRFASEIKFFQFNGAAMVENPALRIAGLTGITGGASNGYVSSAQAVSTAIPVTSAVDALVLIANEVKPPGTSVQYQVSGDGGVTWLPARLGKAVHTPTGNMSGALWKAVLNTTDKTQTPLVKPDIVLKQVYRPAIPIPITVDPMDADGLVRTVTPRLTWTFSDPDVPQGDRQLGFQVLIYNDITGQLVHDTGKISADAAADLPPADVAGSTPTLSAPDLRGYYWYYDVPEGALKGGYKFRWTVRVWDSYDLASDWTPKGTPGSVFEVMALTNLRVTDVVVATGQAKPPLPTSALPVPVRAGSLFNYAVDSLGLVEWVSVTFSDGGSRTTTATQPVNGYFNTWNGDYYTDPTLADGTVVIATFTGGRSDGRITTLTKPIVVISGTVYDDFIVILGDGKPSN